MRELRTEWLANWKQPAAATDLPQTDSGGAAGAVGTELATAPGGIVPPTQTAAVAAGETAGPVANKYRKVSLGGLLPVKKEPQAKQVVIEVDQLEQYLNGPEEDDFDIDVLAWWKAKETKWPALAKMVKQYLAAPASSAGVERVFSAAGKMHGDLKKSAKDTTLQHSLFASYNTE